MTYGNRVYCSNERTENQTVHETNLQRTHRSSHFEAVEEEPNYDDVQNRALKVRISCITHKEKYSSATSVKSPWSEDAYRVSQK